MNQHHFIHYAQPVNQTTWNQEADERAKGMEKALSQEFEEGSNNSARIPRLENPDKEHTNTRIDSREYSKSLKRKGYSISAVEGNKAFTQDLRHITATGKAKEQLAKLKMMANKKNQTSQSRTAAARGP